jgi:hypothetical protein
LLTQCTTLTKAYCTGHLRNRDIAGIWRLTSKRSFLPKVHTPQLADYPLKEFTVYPKKKQKQLPKLGGGIDEDILLLLREDGKYVQYETAATSSKSKSSKRPTSSSTSKSESVASTYTVDEMKGSWALVDGNLILAADRNKDITNIRAECHDHDTILEGRVVAVSDESLMDNPALMGQTQQKGKYQEKEEDQKQQQQQQQPEHKSSSNVESVANTEDVHLSVPKGQVKIGKFFYPQHHPSFFEQPMFDPTSTGSFELRQVLGTLNTQIDDEDKLVELFRKKDLMDKKYFITSYPLPVVQKKRKRWSIKYNKFVDAKPKTKQQIEWEERQKNAPIPIKTFEVELFANNTFQTATGLGDMILRGKWSIVGEKRDQLWMEVWRFGFGRNVSGSTYSEGSTLSNKDDVAYWGEILEVDSSSKEDTIDDDPLKWRGTKIEINGSVMIGAGLEPCSIARFTMIEKTEDDYYDDEDDEDDEDEDDYGFDDDVNNHEDDSDGYLPQLDKDVGSFE